MKNRWRLVKPAVAGGGVGRVRRWASGSVCRGVGLAVAAALGCSSPKAAEQPAPQASQRTDVPVAVWPAKTYYRYAEVRGRRIFYREAGQRGRPTVLLLHGYPSSSHTYRELIPLLSGRYHVLAPDDLGSGYSDHPSPSEVKYSFDLLADHMIGFTEALGLDRYVLYMQDFGGPVGFRIAMAHPERVRALIVQNANAYLDGLTPDRQTFFRSARDDDSPEQRGKLQVLVSDEAIRQRQYLRDVPGEKQARMAPDSWTHDIARLPTDRDRQIQVELFRDYQNNIDAYPRWQEYLRTRRPPTLIVWGEHDPAFIAAGARAYLRDVPDAEVHLLDAGHFAVEEQAVIIAQRMVRFIDNLAVSAPSP